MSFWEEREALSKALEAERQGNVNNMISQMMVNVKEQKVMHMKNIKRLTNEKGKQLCCVWWVGAAPVYASLLVAVFVGGDWQTGCSSQPLNLPLLPVALLSFALL